MVVIQFLATDIIVCFHDVHVHTVICTVTALSIVIWNMKMYCSKMRRPWRILKWLTLVCPKNSKRAYPGLWRNVWVPCTSGVVCRWNSLLLLLLLECCDCHCDSEFARLSGRSLALSILSHRTRISFDLQLYHVTTSVTGCVYISIRFMGGGSYSIYVAVVNETIQWS